MFEKESGDPGAPGPHSKVLDCGVLRVAFHWRGDRYGHSVAQQIGGESRMILESVEGSADEDWPKSPALQSLHVEYRDTGPVALLVGNSGTSHWSASVEPIASQTAVHFDIACRIQRSPGRLGSVYRVAGKSDWSIVQIAALPQEAECQFMQHQELNYWHVRPFSDCPEYPCTIRWRYTISLDNRTA